MTESKSCDQCGVSYPRPKKYSKKQWGQKKYCSIRCCGDAKLGVPRSDEVKQKLSAAHKGTRKPWAGFYERTDEYRDAVRLQLQHMSPEKKAIRGKKISLANLGQKRSDESREKMKIEWKKRKKYKGGFATVKERRAFYQRRREAQKKASGSHSLHEWDTVKQLYSHTCPSCLLPEPVIKLTEDHIIPISMGGSDDIFNIQPLCQPCNSKKMTTPITYLPHDYSEVHKVLSRHLGEKFGVDVPAWPSLR